MTGNNRGMIRRLMASKRIWGTLGGFAAIVLIVAGGVVSWRLLDRDPEISLPDVPSTPALIAKGKYLTEAADCAACHTVPGGLPFSGGLAFHLPFGTIYSSNITADPSTGIGTWSDNDFVRALHRGIAKGGTHLYPAFPYTSYTLLSRDDAVAIKAYLFSLPPVHVQPRQDQLAFPFNQRWTMSFWNLAFLDAHRFRDNPAFSAAENRGDYLATALGHCGECHTPRNVGFAMKNSAQFSGALLEGWHAYDITPDAQSGIGSWSDAQLGQYLHTGHADGRGSAAGPMSEVVSNSLQYLSSDDINAIVAYLRKLKPLPDSTGDSAVSVQTQGAQQASAEDSLGRTIFEGSCSGCHLMNGEGRQTPYASLAGSAAVLHPDGANLVQVLLHGANLGAVHPLVTMPSFAGGFSNVEIAALANFMIEHFSGTTGEVTAADVQAARSQ